MRRFFVLVSLSNLLMFGAYGKLFAFQPWKAREYLFSHGPLWIWVLVSVLIAPFLLAIVLWVGVNLLDRVRHPLVKRVIQTFFCAFAIVGLLNLALRMLTIIPGITEAANQTSLYIIALIVVFTGAAGAVLVCFFWQRSRQVMVNTFFAILLLLAPLMLVLESSLVWAGIETYSSKPTGNIVAPATSVNTISKLPKTVVFLLFDSLSYADAFEQQNVNEQLVNLRKLSEQSIVFSNDHTFPGLTGANMPILLTGKIPEKNLKYDPGFGYYYETTDGMRISPDLKTGGKTVFTLASDRGYQVTIMGISTVDYSLIASKDALFLEESYFADTNPVNFIQAIWEPYQLAISGNIPLSLKNGLQKYFGTTLFGILDDNIQGRTLRLHRAVLDQLQNPEHLFLFTHYMVPHNDMKFDPKTGQMQAGRTRIDSLKTVDYFLGQIMTVLQEKGIWDDTLLIVTGDHPPVDSKATTDSRVTLVIKPPHAGQSLNYDSLFTHAQFLPLLDCLLAENPPDIRTVLSLIEQ